MRPIEIMLVNLVLSRGSLDAITGQTRQLLLVGLHGLISYVIGFKAPDYDKGQSAKCPAAIILFLS